MDSKVIRVGVLEMAVYEVLLEDVSSSDAVSSGSSSSSSSSSIKWRQFKLHSILCDTDTEKPQINQFVFLY